MRVEETQRKEGLAHEQNKEVIRRLESEINQKVFEINRMNTSYRKKIDEAITAQDLKGQKELETALEKTSKAQQKEIEALRRELNSLSKNDNALMEKSAPESKDPQVDSEIVVGDIK